MEVLEGPRLLDIIDDGQADVALEIQLGLTDRLLAADVSVTSLKSLEVIMEKSLSMDATDIPDWAMDVVLRAQSLCRDLLRDQSAWVALHGDLHPRNIMMHEGSWRALDARGVYGPAAFEYANIFINPWDRKAPSSKKAVWKRSLKASVDAFPALSKLLLKPPLQTRFIMRTLAFNRVKVVTRRSVFVNCSNSSNENNPDISTLAAKV